jgi:uncharacterized protein
VKKTNIEAHLKRPPEIPASAWQVLMEIANDEAVDALILFGSRAFGDHEARSDVDVAVCGASITRAKWANMKDAANRCRSLYWISLVHFDRNPSNLRRRILDTGMPIYVRTKTS